jgi:diadenosine tetraphosphate (Ap4A) HIT family hydrolase
VRDRTRGRRRATAGIRRSSPDGVGRSTIGQSVLVATDACPLCAENAAAERGDDPWAIARLTTGYVRLNPTQTYRGATFFASRVCVSELHLLPRAQRTEHLLEMAEVAEAVFRAFTPRKLNYEALGNSVPHLHWWLTPRYVDDPRPHAPIWEDLDFLRAQWTRGARPEDEEREWLKRSVLVALEAQGVGIERRFH